MSILTSGEHVAYYTPMPLPRVMSEVRRVLEMQLDSPKTQEGIFKYDIHAATYLLGKGWRTMILHE